MDTRRSFYLASRGDDFHASATGNDESCVYSTDIPYITPANDNSRVKNRLSGRCGTLLRRLIGLHNLTRTR
jgi:hypothetical protein